MFQPSSRKSNRPIEAISLFTGAGGLDVGFEKAGFKTIFANDIDRDSCETYDANYPHVIRHGDVREFKDELKRLHGVPLVFGGPPCQGFSVAGRMDLNDPRSKLLFDFIEIVKIVSPQVFVCENVKSLLTLDRFESVRKEFINRVRRLGYNCKAVLLNSSNFGVPQNRDRVFFFGVRNISLEGFEFAFVDKVTSSVSVRSAISNLGPAGGRSNPLTCTAKITLASNPVLRKSPYAGMLFNGLGRPIRIDGLASTLPASMGGNKTPIVDEDCLYQGRRNWVEGYHRKLLSGYRPNALQEAPRRLRRLTLREAAIIQTFPNSYVFRGSKSSQYRQIGNAVPCELAHQVAEVAMSLHECEPNFLIELEEAHKPQTALRLHSYPS